MDEPVCTISITTGEETCTVELGDFSKMDEQRYISIGDGKAYLVTHDPLAALKGLGLSDYVSYNVTDAELETFGLDAPELTITLDYSSSDEDGNETDSGTLVLHLSQNPEELAAYEEAVENEEDELPDVTCYARIGESQIEFMSHS